ncbi:hypothetical protein M3084_02595 [Succinatimonas hippei]|uniref:hypothetical protein n=1 Tax=Succinatimonas hippei TaxID=626938 RepID=UPI002012571F|nr:hypothetical protein [Succinatimonas hippei]MCL1602732.1 hypothetical protein [Succinatimonas hippei]
MTNYQEINAWKLKKNFTLIEASFLLTDKIPVKLNDEYLQDNTSEMLLDKLIKTVETDEDGFFYLCGYPSTNQYCSSASGYDEKHKVFAPPHKNVAFPKIAFSSFANDNNLKCEVFSPLTDKEKLKINRKGYETRLLKIMDNTILDFWINFDPSQPDTAPKNIDVVNYIKRYGVKGNIAEAMATIIRHESAPKGRRKKID